MRLIPLLLIAVALALSGCAKKSDDGTSTTSTTTTMPTGSSTTTTMPTGSTTTTTSPTSPTPNGTTPMPMTPKDVKSGSFTFPTDCATPGTAAGAAAACTPVPVTIDAGYANLNFTVTWTCASPGPCASSGASVSVAGLTCTAPATIDPVNTPSGVKCTKLGPATAGAAKITPAPDAAGMVATYKLVEQ